jgi:LPXTG-motif cell wall-anchored protein
VNKVSRTRFDFTAHASASNATVQSYVFTAKDADGNVVDTETVATSALSAGYTLNQDKPGKYTVSVVVKTDKGDAAVDHCVQTVTVEEEETPPTTPPVVEGKTTELPNTGAGAVVGLFAGVSALATAGHFAFRRFIG